MPRKTPRAARGSRPDLPVASMRPRPDAAENELEPRDVHVAVAASMRPRPDAAENWRWTAGLPSSDWPALQ